MSLVKRPAPDFRSVAMVNGEFQEVKLADYRGKFVMLFFYPMDFTFVCPTEIIAFDQRLDDFEEIGCSILGCSVDSQFTHLAWWNTPRTEGGIKGVRYPILADVTKKVTRDYDVLTDDGVALRGTFIIDRNGFVRHATVNDLGIGRSVDEALRVVEAIQFVDEHGEVCPANWEPGRDTLKASPQESKEYFRKAGA
jgi:peroxiredoxin (alkyl hydroperoxide reductase subunit C)